MLDIGPYIFVGILVWACLLSSGVHATIAGVVLGLMTPSAPWFSMRQFSQTLDSLQSDYDEAMRRGDEEVASYILGKIEYLTQGTESVLDRLIRLLHPWTAFLILPIFALANAGVPLSASALVHPVALGIAGGLVVGKLVGIPAAAFIVVRLGLARLPQGVSWGMMAGGGMWAGIGFTMALFIASLALDSAMVDPARAGVLLASVISAALGMGVLLGVLRQPRRGGESASEQG